MKCFKIIVSVFILCSLNSFAQLSNRKHTIIKGETISGIAKKYKVSTASLYQLNPEAKKTLSLNQVLLIPEDELKKNQNSKSITEPVVNVQHEVRTQETLYGIAKKYKTTINALNKANPALESEGLKIGQKITIPSNASFAVQEIANESQTKSDETTSKASIVHPVKPKESMYSIAKQYSITLQELINANPTANKNKLKLGQQLSIPSNGKPELDTVESEIKKPLGIDVKREPEMVLTEKVSTPKEPVISPIINVVNSDSIHEVLPKETKYRIAKQYGLTITELESLNPNIAPNLPVGYKLVIRKKTLKNTETIASIDTIKIETNDADVSKSSRSDEFLTQLINTASDNMGVRYRSGGTTKSGFDCSGLMVTTFGAFDIKLPRTSYQQSNFGTKVTPDLAQKGDLIFFQTNGRSRINHVGMVVEVIDDEIKFIHTSVHGGVMVSSTKETYYNKNFVQVNRVLD